MRAMLRGIDSISEWSGRTVRWLSAVLVAQVCYEIIMRYVFNAPTVWGLETSVMLAVTLYTWAWAYVYKHHGHVRVDIIYRCLSPRAKAAIDAAGVLLLGPLLVVLIQRSVAWAWRSWLINEKMTMGYWYPPAAPLRTMVALGFIVFALQVGAQFLRDLYLFMRNRSYD